MSENLGKVTGRETLPATAVTVAVGLSAAFLPTANPQVSHVWVQPVGGNIRICLDGSTPSASLGLQVMDGVIVQLDSGRILGKTDFTNSEVELFRCIRESASLTPVVEVIYFGGDK
jgi:hypothetical protein